MNLKIGDKYRCPEDHEGKIVWISEKKDVIGVKCSHKHFSKVVRVADNEKNHLSRGRYATKERKIFVRDMVFLVRI